MDNILYEKRTQSEALIQKSGRKSKIQDINICSLFKYKSVRYKFLILNMLWVGTRAVFNGIAISSKSFPGNFYFRICQKRQSKNKRVLDKESNSSDDDDDDDD